VRVSDLNGSLRPPATTGSQQASINKAATSETGGSRHGIGSTRRAPGSATAVASHGGRAGRALPRALRGLQPRGAAAPAAGRGRAGQRRTRRRRRILHHRRGWCAATRRPGSPPEAGACVSVQFSAFDLFHRVVSASRSYGITQSGPAGLVG
jgi:hypothetical protein